MKSEVGPHSLTKNREQEMGRKLAVVATVTRFDALRRMLEERREELTAEVRGRVRTIRVAGATREVVDRAEEYDHNAQDDIERTLLQLKAETLNKINEALAHLEAGRYGICHTCHEEIAEARLRALPFAVRCKDCEEAREAAVNRERARRSAFGFGPIFGHVHM